MAGADIDLSLFPRQQAALQTPANETLYGGAAGGGKSHLMRVAAIIWCYSIPKLEVYIFRRLSTDLYKNHMDGVNGFTNLLDPWVRAGFVKIIQPGRIQFSNGSKIQLAHCQYENSVYQYQGTEFHVLMIDELTHFTESMYTFLRGRCRAVGLKLAEHLKNLKIPRILCGSNPGGIGHNWVKAMFVDMTDQGQTLYQAEEKDGGMLRAYIPARVKDNPALLRDDPMYLSRLEGLGNPELVRAMKLGDWNIVSGGMFDDVWRPDKIVLPQFKIPHTWTLDRSFDWGESKPFSVGWWAETDDSEVEIAPGEFKTFYPGSVVRFHEWYGWNGKPNHGSYLSPKKIAKGILRKESVMEIRGHVNPGPADTNIFVPKAKNDTARRMSKEGVRWVKADKRPGSRENGWVLMREMFENAAQDQPEGPGLYVMENCTHFKRTVPVLPRKDTKPEDVDTESEDHVGDETRYRVWRDKSSVGVVRAVGA